MLLEYWGGSEHWLPSLDRRARDSLIIEAVRAGKPAKVIAAEVVCSVSTVKRVVRQSSGLGRDEWVL